MNPGRLVVSLRYVLMAAWIAAIAVAVPAARNVGAALRVDIPSAKANESTRAHALIDAVFPNPTGNALAVVVSAGAATDSAGFAELVATLRRAVARYPIVREVVSPDVVAAAGSRHAVLLVLPRSEAADDLTEQVAPLRAMLAQVAASHPLGPAADVAVTGEPALEYDAQQVAVNDARRFERWALLPAGLVLIAAFGSLVAAALPLAIGVAAIACALALLTLVGQSFPLAVYVLPIVSMVGLGVGIDYSLLLVSRFREEMQVDGQAAAAATRAVATAGRAVVVSGTTVLIGFAALLLAPSWEIRSVGVGGLLVVACAVALATTLLPAMLSILSKGLDWPLAIARAREARDKSPAVGPGKRVSERLPSVPTGPTRELQRPEGPTARLVPSFPGQRAPGTAFWRHWSAAITQHRWLALAGGLAITLVLAWPLVGLRVGMPIQGWFPARTESARGADSLAAMGFGGELLPIEVVLHAPPGERLVDAAHLGALLRLTDSLATDPRVARVRGPVSLLPGTSRLGYALLYSDLAEARRRHPEIFESYVAPDGRAAVFDVVLTDSASMQTGMEVARDARAMLGDGVVGLTLDDALVGGFFAAQLDTLDELSRTLPLMLVLVLGATAIMLLVAFRSVIVPLKAVVLNLLSLAAAFGLVVFVFQQGHGAGLLGLAGGTERTFIHVPVLVFAIAFGLSMDYEVFLLSRMKEAYDDSGDNDAATSAGLAATASLITSAAAIMVVVFGTFAFSRLLIAQVLGFGLAAAVLIDATVVRLVIVPAFMHAAGKWNWWPGGMANRRTGGPMPGETSGSG